MQCCILRRMFAALARYDEAALTIDILITIIVTALCMHKMHAFIKCTPAFSCTSSRGVLGVDISDSAAPAAGPLLSLLLTLLLLLARTPVQTKDEDAVPLTINCWPSASGGESFVNIEYECRAEFDLQQLLIAIPCHQPPKITQARAAPTLKFSS